MFCNYVKIVFRNMARHKVFSFINIFGTADERNRHQESFRGHGMEYIV
jgi:hypothetical protein